MVKKAFIRIGIPYAVITFILHNVFNTLAGEILMTISYFALFIGILLFLIHWIRLAFKQFLYNRNHKHSSQKYND